ncbi:hypothetical protein Taro_004313 [Colocasia esculenta]|uniref:Retrotransposon gag domain-containing protein n=1 Tax=Colocasia esculenta TaxID=4460 RepID=A0A843TUI6_COLES|nr:hypothetical protein [Colocasia esculenta]
MGPAAVLSELEAKGWSLTVGVQVHGRLHHELDSNFCGRLVWRCMWATRGLMPTCQFSRLYVHPRAALSAHPLSLLPQLAAPESLKVLTGIKEWLVDRGTRGVAELREETSRRGAICVGARGGLGVNRGVAGDSNATELGFLQGLRPGNLASTSFAAKIFSQEVDGQGSCRLLPFLTEPVTREAHPYPHRISGMADRRDWGGGGDDSEESTQRMIERIWESLTDIRARMDQQAPIPPVAVPPGEGEAVPVAPVLPRVEVPFVAPVLPPPPVQLVEEPVIQVEKFLRLQPSTYSGRPNPDTAEHWIHEIERVFATMRCPEADRVVLAAYQLRGFALEWWRLKMQTTFAGRREEAITWSEFLEVKSRVGPELEWDLLLFFWRCMWATRGLTPTCQFSRLYVHPRAALSAHPLSLLPQLAAPESLKVLTGIKEWLVDRGTRGVAELREETSRRGAICVGACGGLGVNRGVAGDSNAF